MDPHQQQLDNHFARHVPDQHHHHQQAAAVASALTSPASPLTAAPRQQMHTAFNWPIANTAKQQVSGTYFNINAFDSQQRQFNMQQQQQGVHHQFTSSLASWNHHQAVTAAVAAVASTPLHHSPNFNANTVAPFLCQISPGEGVASQYLPTAAEQQQLPFGFISANVNDVLAIQQHLQQNGNAQNQLPSPSLPYNYNANAPLTNRGDVQAQTVSSTYNLSYNPLAKNDVANDQKPNPDLDSRSGEVVTELKSISNPVALKVSNKHENPNKHGGSKIRSSGSHQLKITSTSINAKNSLSTNGYCNIINNGKDPVYFEKRRRNNESARRSRLTRRQREEENAMKVMILERDLMQLRMTVEHQRYTISVLQQEKQFLHVCHSAAAANSSTTVISDCLDASMRNNANTL